MAKGMLIAHAYARITPSSSAPTKTCRKEVAPVAVIRAGSTLGAVSASFCTSWLSKPDWAIAIKNVAPIDRKTVYDASQPKLW